MIKTLTKEQYSAVSQYARDTLKPHPIGKIQCSDVIRGGKMLCRVKVGRQVKIWKAILVPKEVLENESAV